VPEPQTTSSITTKSCAMKSLNTKYVYHYSVKIQGQTSPHDTVNGLYTTDTPIHDTNTFEGLLAFVASYMKVSASRLEVLSLSLTYSGPEDTPEPEIAAKEPTDIQVMIDLETLGTVPGSTILTIGAVFFSLREGVLLPAEFYHHIDPTSCEEFDLRTDSATKDWWMNQSAEARREAFAFTEEDTLDVALNAFNVWLLDTQQLHAPINGIWGNGAGFDVPMIRAAYQAADVHCPINHKLERCYRQVRSMYPTVKTERVGMYHNALDDARSQALHLIDMYKYQPWEI